MEITHIQGGMREFERTGIYPEYLQFHLPGTRHNWMIKIKQTPQTGVLKSKGQVIYEYRYDGKCCSFRKIDPDGGYSEWMEPEFLITMMRD